MVSPESVSFAVIIRNQKCSRRPETSYSTTFAIPQYSFDQNSMGLKVFQWLCLCFTDRDPFAKQLQWQSCVYCYPLYGANPITLVIYFSVKLFAFDTPPNTYLSLLQLEC